MIISVSLLFLSAALASCGYRLSGTGDLLLKDAKSIAIPVFINSTNEPYLDVELTKAVVDEFIADGRLRVADQDTADLALRGRITMFDVTPISYTRESLVQQYRVRVVVDASLEDLRTKKVLWQEKGIEALFISDYPVAYDSTNKLADIRATKINKESAVKKASQDIAWTLRSRVLEGF